MVELLKPEGVRAEVSLEADLPQIAYRKLRQVSWSGSLEPMSHTNPNAHYYSIALFRTLSKMQHSLCPRDCSRTHSAVAPLLCIRGGRGREVR